MSPHAESFVYDSQGPMHTGTGDQYNFYDSVRDRFVRESRVVAHEHVRWLYPRFVEPRNYGQAQGLLENNRSIRLTGAPGSGRRAAAQMLLHLLPGADGPIHELPDTWESGEPVLKSRTVASGASGERLLLDLSSSDEKDNGTLLRQLPSYREVVRKLGAYLVVVLPDGPAHHLGAELGPSVVEIGRPDGTAVFQRYLHHDRIPFSRDQLDTDALTELLRSAPMRDIAELAELVRVARESQLGQAFPHWLHEAIEALTKWGDAVAGQVKRLSEGRQRALLLTTAMFSGAPADAVFGATSGLLKKVEQPEDELPPLQRKGFTEQLTEIKATRDGAGKVGFTSLAYDRAVRTHFWDEFPGLRDGFRDWVETAIEQPALTSEDRDMVVTSFAEQALRTGRPDDLRCLAERWAERPRLRPQAARTLERGLKDERHGRFFRRQLYDWSITRNLPAGLAQVVVQVCSEVLALNDPKQAVVRLHHIVRRQSDAVGEVAYHALRDLVDLDRRLCSFLLNRVTRDSRAEQYVVPDTDLFLELAGPDQLTDTMSQGPPLIEDPTVQAQLISGWGIALAARSPRCADRVRDWLAACEAGRFRDLLLGVLVRAGDGRSDVLSDLHVIARDWAHAADEHGAERARVTARLDRKILGIDLIEESAS